MITYQFPPKVLPGIVDKHPILSTSQGGQIAVDKKLLSLWQEAGGCKLEEILKSYQPGEVDPEHIKAGLACLAEAGLLDRSEKTETASNNNTSDKGLVSVVIVSYNSLEWLMECIPSLFSQIYPSLEIIIVDNASTDESLVWVRKKYPQIKLISLSQRSGLASAINRGLEIAEGKYFLILNPDVRLDTEAVEEMVVIADGDPTCAAVAAKLKFWFAPGFLNGIGNRVGAASWGTDNALGHLDLGQFDSWREVPSACFAATLIPRGAWDSVGPLDEGFPLYYEDTEWSYRARLLGYDIRAAPKGRLRFALKLIPSTVRLGRFLLSYWLEDVMRLIYGFLRWDWQSVKAIFSGWKDFLDNWTNIKEGRDMLQSRRIRRDSDLFEIHKQIPPPHIWRGLPELSWDLAQNHYLNLIRSGTTRPVPEFSLDSTRKKLLIVSHDVVDTMLAGTGMRYLEIARAMSTSLDITLAIPNETALKISEIKLIPYKLEQAESLRGLVTSCDVVLISSFILQKFPYLENAKARIVVDLYDPLVLENLHYYQEEPLAVQDNLNDQTVDLMNQLVNLGDYFICANERQRDFWIGVLAANGRVNPRVFAHDASLRSLIDIVGMGIPDRSIKYQPMLRGDHPGFPPEARIVLWGGGIWDWLDPLSLVRAWPKVLVNHPSARLVFLGTRHPNPLVPKHKMVDRVESLADEIGEKGRTIFFFEWLPYEEREALLSEADVGVALHPQHVETRYSIRTRVLDYIWAHLPILVSEGDITSEWVRKYQLGRVVPPKDADAVASALNEILSISKNSWAPQFTSVQEELTWSRVVEPLRNYCQFGEPAQDREKRSLRLGDVKRGNSLRGLISRAWYIWRSEGIRGLSHRGRRYIQWRLS
jgi:glycosyltransferase involved in cell wall biosynthesis